MKLKKQHETVTDLSTLFFEKAPLGYLVLDKKGLILDANEKLCQLLDYAKSELKGRHLAEFINQEDQEFLTREYKSFYQNPEGRKLETRLLRKNNEYFYAVLTGGKISLPSANGKSVEVLLLGVLDITPEYEEQKNLLQEYEYIINAIQEPISILNTDFVYQNVNNAYQQYYSKPLEDIVGHSIQEFIGEELFEKQVKPALEKCLKGEVVHYQSWFGFENCKPFFNDVKYFPYYDTAGKVRRIVVSSRDLTQEKMAEEKAAEAENLLQQIFNIAVPFWQINSDFEVTRVNDLFCSLFNKSRTEVIGKKFYDVMSNEIGKSNSHLLNKILEGNAPSNFIIELPEIKNLSRNIIVHSKTILGKNGEFLGMFEYFTDVTEMKQTEQELKLKGEKIACQNEELLAQNKELKVLGHKQQDIIKQLETTEQLLKESAERYRLLSEVTFEGILIHKNGKAIDANNRFLRLTNFEQEDLEDFNIFDIIPEKDKAKVNENITKEHTHPYRITLNRKNGSSFLAEIEARNFEYKGEQIRIAAIRDITEKVKMEEQLALSEYKFRFYVENAPNGFFAIDADGSYLEVNKAFCEMTGYKEAELLEMGLPDIMHPSSIKQELENFDKLRKEDISTSLITYICQNGEERIWNEIGKRLSGDKYIAFVEDVTEQIIARKKLERNEKLLKFAIEQMPIPVLITGVPDTFQTLYNQPASDLVHYEPNTSGETMLPGQHKIMPMLNPDRSLIEPAEMPLTKAISQGISTKNREIIIPHPDGDRWISASAEPLRDEDGKIIAGIVVFPEITDRIQMEKKLRENQRLLNEVEKFAKIGGWEMNIETGKAVWTKGMCDVAEIPDSEHVPGLFEHQDYYLAEYREMIGKKMSDLINKGIPLEFEAEFITEKGNIRWRKAMGLREMQEGKCVRVYGTFQDITRQKLLEKEINAKTAQMESILNNTSDFILLGDRSGRPVYFNYAYKRVMKEAIGLDVVPGDPPHTHLKNEAEIAYWEKLHSRVLSGESFHAEYSLPYLDGNIHYLELSYSPIIENGKVNGFSEVTRDITERKLSELELTQSEEKYRILAEKLQNLIITHDLHGKILYINQYGLDYLGVTKEQLIGSSIDQFLPLEDQIERVQLINEMTHSVTVKQLTKNIDIINAAGDKRILEISVSPIMQEQQINSMIIIARDVTERHNTEIELAEYRTHLEQLVQERTTELEGQKAELERFNKLFVGREFRIKELREQVKTLKAELIAHGITIDDSDEFLN
ncbi:MAG: PAS domain S-box protein [Candidatus Cloacimonetes bacterium]|nr:PAS domain S-box protein [Candidatus Cloacimonadota bacterium]